jgi:hypothetical protein
MKIDEIIALVRGLEPNEFQQLLALIKDYDAEFQARRAAAQTADRTETERLAAKHVAENEATIARLAQMERREREAQSNFE